MKSKKSPAIPPKSTESKQSRPGVPGLLVDTLPAGIAFGRWKRPSPYDDLLHSLAAAGEGHYLRFDALKARSAVTSRARVVGVKLLFAQQGETLWAMLAPKAKTIPGRTMDPVPGNQAPAEKPAPTLPELALQAVAAKRATAGEIISWMRSRGHVNGLDLTGTEDLLRNLAKQGKIRLQTLKRNEDPDRPDRWMVA